MRMRICVCKWNPHFGSHFVQMKVKSKFNINYSVLLVSCKRVHVVKLCTQDLFLWLFEATHFVNPFAVISIYPSFAMHVSLLSQRILHETWENKISEGTIALIQTSMRYVRTFFYVSPIVIQIIGSFEMCKAFISVHDFIVCLNDDWYTQNGRLNFTSYRCQMKLIPTQNGIFASSWNLSTHADERLSAQAHKQTHKLTLHT